MKGSRPGDESPTNKVFASAMELELIDISVADHNVSINDGVGMVINCDTAGSILKVDTPKQEGYTTLALASGINYITVSKVYKVGSSIVGNVEVWAW